MNILLIVQWTLQYKHLHHVLWTLQNILTQDTNNTTMYIPLYTETLDTTEQRYPLKFPLKRKLKDDIFLLLTIVRRKNRIFNHGKTR